MEKRGRVESTAKGASKPVAELDRRPTVPAESRYVPADACAFFSPRDSGSPSFSRGIGGTHGDEERAYALAIVLDPTEYVVSREIFETAALPTAVRTDPGPVSAENIPEDRNGGTHAAFLDSSVASMGSIISGSIMRFVRHARRTFFIDRCELPRRIWENGGETGGGRALVGTHLSCAHEVEDTVPRFGDDHVDYPCQVSLCRAEIDGRASVHRGLEKVVERVEDVDPRVQRCLQVTVLSISQRRTGTRDRERQGEGGRRTHLLAFFDETIPEILAALLAIFESEPDDLLY
jgi:hypothetical protein